MISLNLWVRNRESEESLWIWLVNNLKKWIEEHDYKGYEPFDGLLSYLRLLTFGSCLLEQILQQTIRQSPFNLRPLLGVKPQHSTKGMGYIARGYLNLYKITGEQQYKDKTNYCLEWLINNKTQNNIFVNIVLNN